MIENEGEIKEDIRRALLAYCRMDTRAMVEVYGRLREVAGR